MMPARLLTQETFWANAPPITGPETEPMAHMPLIIPNHWPLSRSGTRSVTTISVRAISPPPPMPCKERPTRRVENSLATAQTIAPTRKNTKPVRIIGLRPKMWEKEAKLGWKMVEQSKNDVPDQKASMADPLSFWAMIYQGSNLLIDS